MAELSGSYNFERAQKETLGLILAGGRGARLHELTRWRVKPAIPFGGKFRIIDFVLSNCVNSNIRKIGILTQYKSQSLIRHIHRGWDLFRHELGEFIECIPAQKRIHEDWYTGTADAVYQNQDLIRYYDPDFVLILAGDHIYKMDYRPMLRFHIEQHSDLTIACIPVPIETAHHFGIMKTDQHHRVIGFREKPSDPWSDPNDEHMSLASMGIYVFGAKFLVNILREDARDKESSHDFGKDIITQLIQDHIVYAYPFTDLNNGRPAYWRDVGTVDSYYLANMDLVSIDPKLNLYDIDWPIISSTSNYPPAKFVFDDDLRRGYAVNSVIGEGCIISGSQVRNSLLSTNVRVDEYCEITNAVVLPNVIIHKHCRIANCIIDKECIIPEGTEIGINPEEDRKRFDITETGIVLVEPEMLGQRIHQID